MIVQVSIEGSRLGKITYHALLTEQVKRSTQGKLAAATQVQSAEYLKPLFKNLRSRVSSTFMSQINFFLIFPFNIAVIAGRCPCSHGRDCTLHADQTVSES